MDILVLVYIRFFVYILRFSQVFYFVDQGLENVFFNVEKYMILKNIKMYRSRFLNFVYIVVFDDETVLENAKFVNWKFPA